MHNYHLQKFIRLKVGETTYLMCNETNYLLSDDCSTVIISYAETAVASILTFLQSRISPASQVTCKLTAHTTTSCLKQ